jgi:predicted  nucleic acid-binding Zn-ribbon protein
MFGLGNIDMEKIQAKLDSVHFCTNCGIFFVGSECPVCGLKRNSEGGESNEGQTEQGKESRPGGDKKTEDRSKRDEKTSSAVKSVIEWINS